MFKQRELEILLGESIPPPELDLDDETNDMVHAEEALSGYHFASILDAFDKPSYHYMVDSLLPIIQATETTENQRRFCYLLLDLVKTNYQFEFPEELLLYEQEDMNEVYDFINFIQFDHINFVCNVWYDINMDYKTSPNFSVKDDLLLQVIENRINTDIVSPLVFLFLRTYKKDGLIEWFKKSSKQLIPEIKLRILEGGKV